MSILEHNEWVGIQKILIFIEKLFIQNEIDNYKSVLCCFISF